MKILRWRRFTWELNKLPSLENKLPAYFIFREATREESRVVRAMIMTSFALDSAWSDALKLFRHQLDAQFDAAFQRESVPAIVVTHGVRIIAGSVLCADSDAENHLVSGPCVLTEYCNRGLGTALLHHSLGQLRAAGLDRALGVTKENVPACKFVYPKFGSTSAAYDYEPHAVET